MRVSCPSCQTEYDVPDAALTGRTRTLRCATCGNQWQAGPIGDAAPAPVAQTTASAGDYAQRPAPPPDRTALAPVAPVSAPQSATPSWQPLTEQFKPPPPLPPLQPMSYAEPKPSSPLADAVEAAAGAAEARSQADRESFAALLEASRHLNATQTGRQRNHESRRNPWLISILLLALIIAAIWLERTPIMKIWPPSTRLFNAIAALEHK